MQTVTGHLAL